MTASPTLEIRAMAEPDLEAVHELEVMASPDPWSRDLLASELVGDRRDRHWLVATDQATTGQVQVVGFGGMLHVVDEAHIMNVAVDPSWRRRGVARRLLAVLLLGAADRGAIAATLEVRAGNRPAIELYRRFGFEIAGRRPRYYPDREDAEIMWCHRIDRADCRSRFEGLGGLDA